MDSTFGDFVLLRYALLRHFQWALRQLSITVSSTGTLSDTEIDEIIQAHDIYEVELKG